MFLTIKSLKIKILSCNGTSTTTQWIKKTCFPLHPHICLWIRNSKELTSILIISQTKPSYFRKGSTLLTATATTAIRSIFHFRTIPTLWPHLAKERSLIWIWRGTALITTINRWQPPIVSAVANQKKLSNRKRWNNSTKIENKNLNTLFERKRCSNS